MVRRGQRSCASVPVGARWAHPLLKPIDTQPNNRKPLSHASPDCLVSCCGRHFRAAVQALRTGRSAGLSGGGPGDRPRWAGSGWRRAGSAARIRAGRGHAAVHHRPGVTAQTTLAPARASAGHWWPAGPADNAGTGRYCLLSGPEPCDCIGGGLWSGDVVDRNGFADAQRAQGNAAASRTIGVFNSAVPGHQHHSFPGVGAAACGAPDDRREWRLAADCNCAGSNRPDRCGRPLCPTAVF